MSEPGQNHTQHVIDADAPAVGSGGGGGPLLPAAPGDRETHGRRLQESPGERDDAMRSSIDSWLVFDNQIGHGKYLGTYEPYIIKILCLKG